MMKIFQRQSMSGRININISSNFTKSPKQKTKFPTSPDVREKPFVAVPKLREQQKLWKDSRKMD